MLFTYNFSLEVQLINYLKSTAVAPCVFWKKFYLKKKCARFKIVMTDKKKIIIRVDGGTQIGMGHVYRTIALAEKLVENFFIIFITQDETTQKILISHLFQTKLLRNKKEVFTQSDIIHEIELADVFVIDGYQFKKEYRQKIRKHYPRLKLIQIDDDGGDDFEVDAIINHNANAKSEFYPNMEQRKLALGPDYLLIRKDFFYSKQNPSTRLNKIFIAIGGTDPFQIGLHIAKLLPAQIEIEVLTKNEKFKAKNITTVSNLNAKEMKNKFAASDLVITSASMTAWEAIACVSPLVVISWVENQIPIGNFLDKLKLGIYLGHVASNEFSEKFIVDLQNCLSYDFSAIFQNQKQFNQNASNKINTFFETLLA